VFGGILSNGSLSGLAEQIASDGLKGRVFEVSLADLQQDEDQAFRKIKLRAEDVQGKNVLTNFWVCAPFRRVYGLGFMPLGFTPRHAGIM